MNFFEKKMKNKILENFGIFFFNIINAKCGQQSIFSDKITILSYKTIFGSAFSPISENLVEHFFLKFRKTLILGQNGHFLAHLAKIGQNENFYKKSCRAIFYPYCPPTSCRVSEKSLERFPRSIRYIHPNIRTYIRKSEQR